jgi:hypothetical protein
MKQLHRIFASLAGGLLVTTVLGIAPALAVPKEGDSPASARIEDADEHGLELKTLKGKAFVVVYDDKDSAPKSEAFRKDTVKFVKGDALKSKVTVLPVADVSSYGYWPAKGIVKNAVREATTKLGTTVFCDWTGDLRTAYRFKGGTTGVVIVGKDGRVLYAHEGVPTGAELTRFQDALRALS